MDSPLLARLPKFDGRASPATPSDGLGSAFDGAPEREPASESASESSGEPVGEAAMATDVAAVEGSAARAALEAELEAARDAMKDGLGQLEAALQRVEGEAVERVNAAVLDIARRLFPALSEACLADEIGRHIAGLVPPGEARVHIHAAPSRVEDFRAVLAGMATPEARVTVVESESGAAPNRIEVSWGEGGFTVDHDGLLAACLQRFECENQGEDDGDVAA